MSRTYPQPDGVLVPKSPYSPVVVDGDLAVTAGQVGFDGSGDLVPGGIEPQTRQALDNLTACLRAAGCERSDVLKVNAYLADLGDFEAFNAVYREYFQEPYPARTTVGVSLPGGILVEIEASARSGVTQLDVETPAPVVDLDRLERNLSTWQARCDALGLANRPHVKTHKCTEIARRQVALGAAGLTCQTLGEAEVMADAGLDDLLVALYVLGERKLARLTRLLERAAITVAADDARVLPGLDRAAASSGRELRVLVECDTGLGRTGVADPEAAAALAAEVAGFGSLRFGGFMTYPSPPEAIDFLARAVELAEGRGLEVETVSAGGTPAMWEAGELRPPVTEYRAGTYAFHDRATVAAGAATLEDVALTVCATVVSRPARDRAILDAGSKALSSDLSAEAGFGLVLEAPHSTITQLNEEHGYLELANGDDVELGAQVRIVPNHACVVSNLFAEFALVRDGVPAGGWTVDARGR